MKFKSTAGSLTNLFDAYSAQDLTDKLQTQYLGRLAMYMYGQWWNVDTGRSDSVQLMFKIVELASNVIVNPKYIIKQKSRAKLVRVK